MKVWKIVMMTKKEMRQCLRIKREALTGIEESNKQIYNNLLSISKFINCRYIGYYCPYKNEVDISQQVTRDYNSKLAFPYIKNKEMRYLAYTTVFETTKIGVKQPIETAKTALVAPDIILLPVIAVNSAGYRLGYGGGYYDRYLQKNAQAIKIALAYEEQIISENFQQEWDIPVDYIVTETAVYRM